MGNYVRIYGTTWPTEKNILVDVFAERTNYLYTHEDQVKSKEAIHEKKGTLSVSQ